MANDERHARVRELYLVIDKAERELEKLEPRKSFLEKIQEDLDEFEAERAAGENLEDKAAALCELLAAGLNSIQSALEGHVAFREGAVAISTTAGQISYDPEANEWFFVGWP